MVNKTIKKLDFEDYTCEIMDDGDIHFVDYHAEHMIYVYKSEFEKILKLYKSVFLGK